MTTDTINAHLDELTDEPTLSPLALQTAAEESVAPEWWEKGHEMVARLAGFRLNAESEKSVRLLVNGKEEVVGDFATSQQDEDEYDGFQGEIKEGLRYENGAVFSVNTYRHDGGGTHSAHDGDIIAPMPGKVIAVDVAEGDAVTAGQRLMVLEAMKMEHALTAPFDGTVTGLSVKAGSQVQVDALLCVVEKDKD
jgi:3-methylcrotonyl-CoA carboxylase alpha subunit